MLPIRQTAGQMHPLLRAFEQPNKREKTRRELVVQEVVAKERARMAQQAFLAKIDQVHALIEPSWKKMEALDSSTRKDERLLTRLPKAVKEQEKKRDVTLQLLEKIEILENVLGCIESQFPPVVRNLQSATSSINRQNAYVRLLLKPITSLINNIKTYNPTLQQKQRYIRDVILNPDSYRELPAVHFPERCRPLVWRQGEREAELEEPEQTLVHLMLRNIRMRGGTQCVLREDPDDPLQFIISIGWPKNKKGVYVVEHFHFGLEFQKGGYSISVDRTEYNRSEKPLLAIAHLRNAVQAQKNEIERLKNLPKSYPEDLAALELAREKIGAMLHSEMPQKYGAVKSAHSVYILEAEKSVFKVDASISEMRAQAACGWLGAPQAVVPSHDVTVQVRTLQPSPGLCTYEGIVQPLVPQRVHPKIFFEKNRVTFSEWRTFLDIPDTQKKVAVQALLGAWDLHRDNGVLTPVTLQGRPAEERSLPAVGEFLGIILDYLGNKAPESHALVQTFGARWRFEFFDNEMTLGGEREELTRHPNALALLYGSIVLPVRSFLLGHPISEVPLDADVREWIIGLKERRSFIEREAFQGHHALWGYFSDELKRALRAHLKAKNIYSLTTSPAMLPLVLQEKIAHALQQHKIFFPESWKEQPVASVHKENLIGWIESFFSWGLAQQQVIQLRMLQSDLRIKYQNERAILTTYTILVRKLCATIQQCRASGAVLLDQEAAVQLTKQCEKFIQAAAGWDKRVDDSPPRIRTQCEKYRNVLAATLMPCMAPSEAEAFLQRIDAAINYIERCNSRQGKAAALLGAGEQNRGNIIAYVQELEMNSVAKLSFIYRFMQAGSGEFLGFVEELERYSSPTLLGLHIALFPYFEPVIHLMTQLEFIKNPSNYAAFFMWHSIGTIKAEFARRACSVNSIVCQLSALSLTQQGALHSPTKKLGELIDRLHAFHVTHAALWDTTRFLRDKWGPKQATAIMNAYAEIDQFIASGFCMIHGYAEDRYKKEWHTACRTLSKRVQESSTTSITAAQHEEYVHAVQKNIEKMVMQLKPEYIEAVSQLFGRPFLVQQFHNAMPLLETNLLDIREKILREELLYSANNLEATPYSHTAVGALLKEALEYCLLPGGVENPLYKVLQAVIANSR